MITGPGPWTRRRRSSDSPLFSLPAGGQEVLNLLERAREGPIEIAPGCSVTYELAPGRGEADPCFDQLAFRSREPGAGTDRRVAPGRIETASLQL